MSIIDIDFKNPAKQVLVDLIRYSNNDAELNPDWISFLSPAEHSSGGDIPRNTQIYVQSEPGSPLTGGRFYYYNRVQASDFLHEGVVTAEDMTFRITTELTTTSLEPLLAETLDIHPSHVKLVSAPLPFVGETSVPITVQWLSDCLTTIGELQVYLMR